MKKIHRRFSMNSNFFNPNRHEGMTRMSKVTDWWYCWLFIKSSF